MKNKRVSVTVVVSLRAQFQHPEAFCLSGQIQAGSTSNWSNHEWTKERISMPGSKLLIFYFEFLRGGHANASTQTSRATPETLPLQRERLLHCIFCQQLRLVTKIPT